MDRDRGIDKTNPPVRPSLLRALMEHVRGRVAARRKRTEFEQRLHELSDATILSEEGSREVLEEIKNGSPLTPERRETFELMQQMAGVRRRSDCHLEDPADPYRPTPPLSLEGSREVEEEMARPPADTPERRALFERVRVRAAMRARLAEMEGAAQKP